MDLVRLLMNHQRIEALSVEFSADQLLVEVLVCTYNVIAHFLQSLSYTAEIRVDIATLKSIGESLETCGTPITFGFIRATTPCRWAVSVTASCATVSNVFLTCAARIAKTR